VKPKKARQGKGDDPEEDDDSIVLPSPQDVMQAIERPPVQEIPIRSLEWDLHTESGQIRDVDESLVNHYFRRLRDSPPPVRLVRGTVVATGSMPCVNLREFTKLFLLYRWHIHRVGRPAHCTCPERDDDAHVQARGH
jgi:hypothetical protein